MVKAIAPIVFRKRSQSLEYCCCHCLYNEHTINEMKVIRWNLAKNEKLKSQRGVSFEAVLAAMDRGDLLDDYIHPNQSQYPNQRLLVVQIQGYAYIVPYIETESELFLKTIIPSRKATKQYLRGSNNHE
ncbi:MAG: hypothetical protein RLZZ535_3104 [Cyanobacteriota bacterium]